ncbi:MAG: nucleotidyltransferase family protein [Legionella sp.]|jgi:hypothetical protein|nr:nucleotidyltransferase family protein [Legionella sp.]
MKQMWNSDHHTPEMIFLRMCCRRALGQMNLSACLPYFKHALDEARFFELLQEHRLLLLVYQVLSTDFKAYVSDAFLHNLKNKAHPIFHAQLVLMRTARDVQHVFEQQNISHIFLKGPRLNQMLWGRRMMRYSRDLDVLVLPPDMFKANTALRQLDFKSELSDKSLCFHQRFHAWTTKKDAAYWKKGMHQCIELHWKTYCTEFILSSQKKRGTLLEFTDEEHVLYLCLHAAKHGWLRMLWLIDIVALLQTKHIDIFCVRTLAKSHHITPVVDEMMLLAEQWLGITLYPKSMLIELQKRDTRLQQRVTWAKPQGLKSFFHDMLGRYFANAFCSSRWRQVRLWIQIFLGAVISKSLASRYDGTKS